MSQQRACSKMDLLSNTFKAVRLNTWLQRKFRGVATKYLPNYLAWRRVLEWFKEDVLPEHFVKSALGTQVIDA
jgi:hypothetical protein